MMLRDLKELEPGKVYALEAESRLSRHAIEQIQVAWREQAPQGAKLIVLDGGMKITELSQDRLRELGLIP